MINPTRRLFQAVSGRGQIQNMEITAQVPANPVNRCAFSDRPRSSSNSTSSPASSVEKRWSGECGQSNDDIVNHPPKAILKTLGVGRICLAVSRIGKGD
ncbi:MAG TPA: hypothetical protein VH374_12255 [Polyangia bacterium]|jgi:hypothetical protein|nr:hypothetical protein [Polyangia bacterium]